MCYNMSNWCSLWATQLVLWKFVKGITGNDTDLGFFYHNPSFVDLMLLAMGCLLVFFCPRNILMIKCSLVYLFNRYCNFHMCLNKHCQLQEVTSVFWLSSFIKCFSVDNPCLVMPRGNVIIIPRSIWWAESCFYGERLGSAVMGYCSSVLLMSTVVSIYSSAVNL